MKSSLRRFYNSLTSLMTANRQTANYIIRTPLYTNSLFLIANNLAGPALGVVFWLVVARLYHPEDVGLSTSTISSINLLALTSNLGLGFGLIRFLPVSKENPKQMMNTALTLAALCSLVSGGIFLAGINVWAANLSFLRQNVSYALLFMGCTVTATLSTVVAQSFIAMRKANFVPATELSFAVLRLPLLVIFGLLFGSISVLAAWSLAMITAVIIAILVFIPRALPGYRLLPMISRSVADKMLRFSLVNHFSNLFWAVPGFVLPLIVLNLKGAESGAYFYIVWSISSIITMIPLSTSLSLFAEGSTDEASLLANTKRALKLTFIVIIPATILVLIIADKILLIYGKTYSDSSANLFRILALAAIPTAVNYIFLSIQRVRKKLANLAMISVSIMLATLILSYTLVPRIGIDAIGYASLASQGIAAVAITIRFFMEKRTLSNRRFWT